MGQFIHSDCNTWKASRPSPHSFMAAHKNRPSSPTVAVIKINTAPGLLQLLLPLVCYMRRAALRWKSATQIREILNPVYFI